MSDVLKISKYGKGWTLQDADGAYLMIGHHGCVAPTRRAARDEAERRIDRGDGYTGYVG
jgi:hypothetical protein